MTYAIKVALLSAILIGCAHSPPPVGQKLDPQTSVTITYSPVPILLYRDDPVHAAHARNFVSLAPLEVDRSGDYKYFLWLAIWNTNHSVGELDGRDGFESLILYADGEPLELDVAGWSPSTIGASEPVFSQPVASAIDAYYEVTADQLRFIADASQLSLRTTGFETQSFELWDQQTIARDRFKRFVVATY